MSEVKEGNEWAGAALEEDGLELEEDEGSSSSESDSWELVRDEVRWDQLKV